MSDTKLDQAVFRIFKLTHQDELVWIERPAPEKWEQGTDSVYPIYFQAEYRGRNLALFQERTRLSDHSKAVSKILGPNVGGSSNNEWSDSAHLVLLGDNDEPLFEFPPSRQIRDLFEAVRYKAANVEDFLDELLKSESVDEK